ncbi:MAG: MCE family protein [Verrucomicrobiae bacterium]|nr:MCE family protein [Verrucomicrobiae bacterium]
MALQDLTPQLRTRMTRVERLVGLFVALAALLMAAVFAYYLRDTGKRRGWFVNKIPYYCYTTDATGLKAGDPVRLLGRDVGRILQVEASPPDPWFIEQNFNVFVKFEVWEPYFGYIWSDSRVRVVSADFFGSRYIEVTRGENGLATVWHKPHFEDTEILSDKDAEGRPWTGPDAQEPIPVPLRDSKNGVWLFTDETPSIAQQAEQIVRALASSLPPLTDQVAAVLAQTVAATSNANLAIAHLQPTLQHVQGIAGRLESEDGAVGRMLLTTNLQAQVDDALAGMDAMLDQTTSLLRTSEQQMLDLTRRIAMTLDNVALVTSNLSRQVDANSLVLGEVSSLVTGADDTIRGLQRHWLLRSAFRPATNPPVESALPPSLDRPFR